MTVIILSTSTKETYFDASPNISNKEHSHYGSNSTQILLYDFVFLNANSGTASMTNTLTFVCHNHIKYQILQNPIESTCKKPRSTTRSYHTTTSKPEYTKSQLQQSTKIGHFNNNATSQTTNETRKQPKINHHSNHTKNNLIKTTNRYHTRSHNQITPIPIIILTVRNINHLTKPNNSGHHISNNHNNLLTVRFHHATMIRDHYQMTDDNKILLFILIMSKRSNRRLKLLHHYMRKHLYISPSS